MTAVRDVGLAGYLNTSYQTGLTALVEDRSPRYAVIDVGTNSVKFHVAERAPGGGWRRIVDRAEVTRLGEGLAGTGHDRPRADGTNGGGDHRHGRGGEGERRLGNRRGRDRRPADRDEQRGGRGRDPARRGRHGRGHPRRRGGAPRVPGRPGRARPRRGADRRVRHRRRQQPVHLRPGRPRRRALQRRRRRRALHGALRPRSEVIAGDPGGGRSPRSPPTSRASTDGRAPDALVGMGGAITNITAVKHEMATYDPDRVQGTVLDRAEIDRQIERYRTPDRRRAARDRRPPAQARGGDPRRRAHRANGDGQARPGPAHGERPRVRHGVLIERFGESPSAAPAAVATG